MEQEVDKDQRILDLEEMVKRAESQLAEIEKRFKNMGTGLNIATDLLAEKDKRIAVLEAKLKKAVEALERIKTGEVRYYEQWVGDNRVPSEYEFIENIKAELAAITAETIKT